MEVKGTSLTATKNFIIEKFGQSGYKMVMDKLPQESRAIFEQSILANNWYPFKDAFVKPTKTICDIFYGGSEQGAREIGKFSAEKSLKGIYRAFARVASVNFILERTASIFKTYYTPGRMDVVSKNEHQVIFHMLDIDESDILFEHRICGWIIGALLICNNREHKVEITKSVTRGDQMTEIVVNL
jgi:hypothetical protein